MPHLTIHGVSMWYDDIGSGPPLLLVHGLGSSGDDWAFQRDALGAKHRLVMPDLRGSGRSDKPRERYSIDGFARDLWALCDALALQTVDIVGFSLGGAVALEMALREPGRVRRLVLCNTLANYRTDTWRKRGEAWLQTALVRLIGLRRTATLISRRLFPHPEQAPKRQRVIDVLSANPRGAYLRTMRALIGWHALDRLHALRAPTLLIAAEHDYTPLADKRIEAALYPSVEFVVVPDSRHGTPFDATDQFNALVLRFLATD